MVLCGPGGGFGGFQVGSKSSGKPLLRLPRRKPPNPPPGPPKTKKTKQNTKQNSKKSLFSSDPVMNKQPAKIED